MHIALNVPFVYHYVNMDEAGLLQSAQEFIISKAIPCKEPTQKKKLVLCYEGECEAGGLAQYLRSKLPAYMVPNRIIPVEALPRTPNGKLDRRALAAQVIG